MAEHPHSAGAAGPARERLVQFYDSESELLSVVVPFLVEGLDLDESVVVIATEPRRLAFERALESAAAGFSEAVTRESYVSIDATEILLYLRDAQSGQIDADEFEATIGALVRRHLATGARLRAYAETVPLLWEAGDAVGAIALEEMFDQLYQDEPFTLFCCYPVPSSPTRREAVRHVCRSDSYLLPTITEGAPRFDAPPISAEFTPNLQAPGRARALLRSALLDLRFDSDLIERSTLAVSELTANAVVHAHTPFRLLVQPMEGSVWIAVEDHAPLIDRHAVVGRSPHGLGLIAALALRWGVNVSETGKVIWAELPQ